MTSSTGSQVLTVAERKELLDAVQNARKAAESAASVELDRLAVSTLSRPGYLTDSDNALRLELRAKARQLGIDTRIAGVDLTPLKKDVAYEQWHRLLFARFLEVNGLLIHPVHQMAISYSECEDFAAEEGFPDAWTAAASYASRILPGVFRLSDPAVQVRYAPESRAKLEEILDGVSPNSFLAEDALGWVYQFWQTSEKKRVNDTGNKIGSADLSPVTQLFTENYMVRFLLENSLGAWWAGKHPDSPLLAEWKYLRYLDDGTPAAGTFEEWPATVTEVTVMDPCCGSGHFLVAAFGMLWRMRAEEQGLSLVEAQNAVLRENLFGLELDPRCTQIAMFNVALEAWKQGGHRELPSPQIACAGVPVRQTRDEWLEDVPDSLLDIMSSLHEQFQNADTLGSLIDPRPSDSKLQEGSLFGRDLAIDISWEELAPHLEARFANEGPGASILGQATEDIIRAATLLANRYTLVATNVPFLLERRQSPTLREFLLVNHAGADEDLATALIERSLAILTPGGTTAFVSPQSWLSLKTYRPMRKRLLERSRIQSIARLGPGAFREIKGEVVQVALCTLSAQLPDRDSRAFVLDLVNASNKQEGLLGGSLEYINQKNQLTHELERIHFPSLNTTSTTLLSDVSFTTWGTKTGDDPRFRRRHWEVPTLHGYEQLQSSASVSTMFAGCSDIVATSIRDPLVAPGASVNGDSARKRPGVVVKLMQDLPVVLSTGALFDQNVTLLTPFNSEDVLGIWMAGAADEINQSVRLLDANLKVSSKTVLAGRVDLPSWREASAGSPLPEPFSLDATQWLFRGAVAGSTEPLQVAAARLLGYRWPAQRPDELDDFADGDGIVALAALQGEQDATTRLRLLLARAYGAEWSTSLEHELVVASGEKSGDLGTWLRDTFFNHHVKVFGSRPFLWHLWDGRKDGFSAIVNYHRLDHATLSKLTYSTLGRWIERQRGDAENGEAGADARLAAALDLQRRLALILDGESPHDVYVRWKPLHEQPIGWQPDLDDGVRLNIRPFVTAGVLRGKVNVKWEKDRGKNPDGTDRLNDLHPSLAERRASLRQFQLDQEIS